MTRIKLCGISRLCDIDVVNELKPEYIGFVFAPKSKRYVTDGKAAELKKALAADIKAVGVFVDEPIEHVVELLNNDIIDVAQLHGNEDEKYISSLREHSNKPIIKAFTVTNEELIENIERCTADYVLLDSGAGSGECFEWNLIKNIKRPFFLAGGLDETNVKKAISEIKPFAVDVSSKIETDGLKDEKKMITFVKNVRQIDT